MSSPTIHDKLVFSASANNLGYVRQLLSEGADPNHIVTDRGSSLYAGAHYPLIVSTLLDAGADPNGFISPEGENAMDKALSWITAAHSALIFHRAGAVPRLHTIRNELSGYILAPICVSVGVNFHPIISCGQVLFGNFYGEDRRFEWGSLAESGYLVTIEGINSPTSKSIFSIRQESNAFKLHDYKDNMRTIESENCDDLILDALFRIHNG